jgi:solute carrier family 25 (mitochondrial oxoglutarate transporter), member 11
VYLYKKIQIFNFFFLKGSGPTVFRAMALNMGMLASFDQAKELLQQRFGAGWTSTLLYVII